MAQSPFTIRFPGVANCPVFGIPGQPGLPWFLGTHLGELDQRHDDPTDRHEIEDQAQKFLE